MTKLILLGAGGHCESVIEVIESLSNYNIEGVLDPTYIEFEEKNILGYPLIGNDDKIEELINKGYEFVITVGQIKSANIRKKLYSVVKSKGGKLPVIIASTSSGSKYSVLGEGTVMMNFSMANSNSRIGICNIINTFADIEHGCHLGDFNHISTRATLNGGVMIGHEVFIGSGTIVNEGCCIGDKVVISSGCLIRKNINSRSFAFGNPTKIVKR